MVSATTLLQIWESIQRSMPADRSLQLLSFALPDCECETLASFDLATRDWHLLRLRLAMFGPEVVACAECPECGERLEVQFDGTALDGNDPSEPPLYTSTEGHRFRLPNVGDLVAIAPIDEGEAAARRLFERCRLDRLPNETILGEEFEEVDERLEAMAADRGIHLDLSCAMCGSRSRHALDSGEFLWSEIASRAALLLDEVHRLAQAYKWSERDILTMSAARRAAYLGRVE